MTKKIARTVFFLYQVIFFSPNRSCRFTPTCSAYALTAVGEHGPVKGIFLSLRRILSCHPFSARPVYDPVPDLHKSGLTIRINS